MQQICTGAKYDDVFFAYLIAIPRQSFSSKDEIHIYFDRNILALYDFSSAELLLPFLLLPLLSIPCWYHIRDLQANFLPLYLQ